MLSKVQLEMLGHYAQHRSRRRAYEHVYPDEVGAKTPRELNAAAQRAFRSPLMREAMAQMEATAMARVQIDAAWVLRKAVLLADFNIAKFVVVDNETGQAFYDFSEASDDDWYCIQELTVDEITRGRGGDQYEVERVKLKSFDKLRALELVAKHRDVQALEERINLSGQVGIAQIPVEDYKRAREEMLKQDDV